ncbi:hypothetical protein [Streptomyces sp. YS415]|uniref:hypothetical protein n=1 Tax=Streptomyces sp. YS415 TaxID=2944806 RepID=UPI002021DC3A|nr:hypothetical protein [Streptomyces sp. YS415]MCL7429035.1 hypothetical protein [Streptomyces sp. YS415]
MADEQYRWLDPRTAERLLSGEPLEAVDAADRDRAERLARALEALAAQPPAAAAELPGEAAALAAFRAARTERADAPATPGHRARPHSSDAGLVRIGPPERTARRPRWARPVRLGLAAAMALGMVGGVAVAAGTGILPTPFEGTPEPAVSAPAAVPTGHPPVSPSPEDAVEGESVPEGTSGGATPDPDTSRGTGGDGADPGAATGDPGDRWSGGKRHGAAVAACRDVSAGKRLTDDSRRALEAAAGGSARVPTYCKALLGEARSGSGSGNGKSHGQKENADRGSGQDEDEDDDQDEQGDRDTGGGGERGRDKGKDKGHSRPGDHRRTDGTTAGTASSPTPPHSAP